MTQINRPEGTAVVYCEGHFATTEGKTAHGLVRHTERYRVVAVIDSQFTGRDAGFQLDGVATGIPIVDSLDEALDAARARPDFLVIGVATHGGILPVEARPVVLDALKRGIHVDAGLHEMLGDDTEFARVARDSGARIRDVRSTPSRSEMHPFTGEILKVEAVRVAVLGTDSGVGKRTTSVKIVQGLIEAGLGAVLVGTGQTAWMQGVRYGLILDSLVNDFVSGEIEHQVCRAFREAKPDVIVIEGQGCMTHPAYPGGFEILAGAQPDAIVLQHAPARRVYDGFPDFPIAGLEREMKILDLLCGKPIVAVTLNHEELSEEQGRREAERIRDRHSIPCCDPLRDGVGPIVEELRRLFPRLSR